MRIGNRALPVGKISLLIVLLLVGLVVVGCTGISGSPAGGSGATIADGTIFLSPSLKQAGGFGCSTPAVEGKLVAVNAESWHSALGGCAGRRGAIGGLRLFWGDDTGGRLRQPRPVRRAGLCCRL